MGPRSADRGNHAAAGQITEAQLLQWGSDQLIAEICSAAEVRLRIAWPSMGPRSADRGNLMACLFHPRHPDALQWGRDQLIAEIDPDNPTETWHSCLQWGRDQLIAEMT